MKGFLAAILAIPAALTNAAATGLQFQQANFDDIQTNAVLSATSLQPIGTYKGLNWDGFNVINVGAAPLGVTAQSNPNVAVSYVLSTGLTNVATLKPASSKTAYFSLQSFYFGCVAATQESVASLPIDCSLKLTGKRKGKVVVTQDISFSPGLLALKKPMKKISFAGQWANVDEVDFAQTGQLSAATGVLYDNFQFTTFTLK